MTVLAPVLVGTALPRDTPLQPPSDRHLLGTDASGLDNAALLVYGGAESLVAAAWSFNVAFALGFVVAIAAGYVRGKAASISAFANDFILMIPWIPFAILPAVILGRAGSTETATLGVALIAWAIPTRSLRLRLETVSRPAEEKRREKGGQRKGEGLLDFVEASLPQILSAALFAASIGILMNAGLAFLGFAYATVPSWGDQIRSSYVSLALLRGLWWALLAPALLIWLSALSFGLLSHGLGRDS